jgi:4'-phosphopantetheinyl transferase
MIDIYGIKITTELDRNEFNMLLNRTSLEKRNRISRFKFIQDARRCLFGDLIVRYVLCNKLNVKNGQLQFGYNEYGKPFLLEPSGFHFNMSHSGDWVVCGTDTKPVGIDVEFIKYVELDIAKRFFSTEEYDDLIHKDKTEEILKYFYILWTLKESYIKAAGKGLSIPLDSFSFTINNGDISIKTQNDFGPCYFFQKEIDERHIVSACALNAGFDQCIYVINVRQLLSLDTL